MGVNWLAGLHHRTGRPVGRAHLRRAETGGRESGQLQGGRRTAVIAGQIPARPTTLSRHWPRRAEQWWRGIT